MTLQICAWCTKTVRRIEDGRDEDVVSHGVCVPCASKVLAEVGLSVQRDENGFARPVSGSPSQSVSRNKKPAAPACAVSPRPRIEERARATTPARSVVFTEVSHG